MTFQDLLQMPDNPRLLSPGIMAYIGDSVYELFIRSYLIESGIRKNNKLHKTAIKYVNAEAQAEILQQIRPNLTEEEETIVRRGRNCNSGQVPQSTDVVDYRYSTAFEALLGYLYLAEKKERLIKLLTEVKKQLKEM